ncbi:MAG: hypothetical protein AB3N17_03480 [Tateyamaria sp.]
MQAPWQKYTDKVLIAACVAIGLAVLFWPAPKPAPEVLDNIFCAAEATVLAAYVFDRDAAGDPVDADLNTRVQTNAEKAQDYLRGLRRRDDPGIPEIRPTIVSVEQQHQAAIENDPNRHVTDTLDRQVACIANLSGVTSS